jgi:hypothetical protein
LITIYALQEAKFGKDPNWFRKLLPTIGKSKKTALLTTIST